MKKILDILDQYALDDAMEEGETLDRLLVEVAQDNPTLYKLIIETDGEILSDKNAINLIGLYYKHTTIY